MTILDFEIEHTGHHGYALTVRDRDTSEVQAKGSFSYEISALENLLLARLNPDLKDPHARLDRLKVFGQELYTRVFTEEVETAWKQYRESRGFLVCCVRLADDARGLQKLPWETLHDGESFLAAGLTTGLSRLPLAIEPTPHLQSLPSPLEMLGVVSCPLDLEDRERLNVEREQEILLDAVNAPSGQGRLRLQLEDEAKLPIIMAALSDKPNIVHYTGHGGRGVEEGVLLLENEKGERRHTAISELSEGINAARPDLRLAVLSGCQTAANPGCRWIPGFSAHLAQARRTGRHCDAIFDHGYRRTGLRPHLLPADC